MKTLEELRRRIHSVEDMQSVVSTMKTLAATRIRQYDSAANATKAYSQTVRLAFQVLMRDRKASGLRPAISQPPERTVVVLLGSDQGFCGRFNETVARAATGFLENRELPLVLVAGARLRPLMTAAGHDVQHALRLPHSVEGIAGLVRRIVVKIERWQGDHGIRRVELFYNQRKTGSLYEVRKIRLLPIATKYLENLGKQPWPSRSRPVYPTSWDQLFSRVVRQHLFLRLFRACAESLASENASRIAAMQKAESNIRNRLEQLHMQFNQSRQRTITEELLDILSGFEATRV